MHLEYLPDGSLDCPLIRLYELRRCSCDSFAPAGHQSLGWFGGQDFLDVLEEIILVDGCKLALVAGGSDHGVLKTAASNQFECVLTPASWANVAGLIKPFCEPGASNGFQWLDETSDISLLLSPDGLW